MRATYFLFGLFIGVFSTIAINIFIDETAEEELLQEQLTYSADELRTNHDLYHKRVRTY